MRTALILTALLGACAPVIPEPERDPATRPEPDDADDTGSPDPGDAPLDEDGDGFSVDEDCDDQDPTTFPGAPERCDPVDHNCDDTAFTADDCPCPNIRFEGGVFLSGCAEPATWGRAFDICALYDMRLVVASDAQTNRQVQALVSDLRRGAAWIGLSDRAAEGSFTWVDGTRVGWSNWSRGEPNDFGRGEDCVQMYPWNGEWNDADCALQAPFVCEPDPDAL